MKGDDRVLDVAVAYLTTQFSRARPILFTGAGFSRNARNVADAPLPSSEELARHLWSLVFPDDSFDRSTSLQTLYEAAARRRHRALPDLLRQQLTVNSESLPDWYATYLAMPWFRMYTLNIDDLATAVARAKPLPRDVTLVSATSPIPERAAHGHPSADLEVVHLNGTLADAPDHVTFSVTQYAQRLGQPEPWYARLVVDLASRPCIFVGTRLEESALWQHIELRETRGGRGTRELRPRSYLVTPRLDRARVELLQDYNVHWLAMGADDFASRVLSAIAATAIAAGHSLIVQETSRTSRRDVEIPRVSSLLSAASDRSTGFLLGQEPAWEDVATGRVVARAADRGLWNVLQTAHAQSPRGLVVVTGTAGSGKSSSLMRAAAQFEASGVSVGFLDRENDFTTHQIRDAMRRGDAPSVLVVDDIDSYGSEASSLVREIAISEPWPLIVAAARSSRLDRVIHPAVLGDLPTVEVSMPHLEDDDIDGLIDILKRENLLGALQGKTRPQQRALFRESAGRQLLVAMIQATSGERFEEKAVSEFRELTGPDQRVYALVAVSSALRYSMGPDEVLLAAGDHSNEALNRLEQLVSRHVIARAEAGTKLRARHRVIAELVLRDLAQSGQLEEVMRGLALVASTKVAPGLHRSDRAWRFLRAVLNHDFLARELGVEAARRMYQSVQELLSWEYHYWLQRGSLEVEVGNLALAKNYLSQSRALAGGDPIVDNEWAYLLFRLATARPMDVDAPRQADEAFDLLTDLMRRRGQRDPYPYHVLGSQGLSWSRRGIPGRPEAARYLRRLIDAVDEGIAFHPASADLRGLRSDLMREYLGLAVRNEGSTSPTVVPSDETW